VKERPHSQHAAKGGWQINTQRETTSIEPPSPLVSAPRVRKSGHKKIYSA